MQRGRMTDVLRLLGLGIAGLIVLWILLEVVVVLISIVGWLISTIVTLAVVAVLAYAGYLLVTALLS